MLDSFNKLPRWLQLWLIFPLAFLNGWLLFLLIGYLEPLVNLFVTATLFAFLLNFPINFLQRRGFSKAGSIVIVLLLALLILGTLALILVPLIVQQLSDLVNSLPQWIESGSQQIQVVQKWAIAKKLSIDLTSLLTQAADRLSNLLQSLSIQLLNVLGSAITIIVNILIILVLTVFLVVTGESVWDGIFSWIPTPWDVELRESLRKTFGKYFATQAILAGILSGAQIILFAFLGVPYAVLFAVAIGITTLIPYASGFTIILVSLLVSLQNLSLGLKMLGAAILVGQINDNIIAPRLMGGMTGLNPVWIIISLFIGGKVGGILGLLVAVPLASVIKSTTDQIRLGKTDK
jgi:predicted PurR-regulated permease PerM